MMDREFFRCLHCDIELEGEAAWIEHLNSQSHRQSVWRRDNEMDRPLPMRAAHDD